MKILLKRVFRPSIFFFSLRKRFAFWFSANAICLNQTCFLKCLNCNFWQNKDNVFEEESSHLYYLENNREIAKFTSKFQRKPPEFDLGDIIKKEEFFKIFQKRQIFDLVGSEPLDQPDLLLVINYLKSKGIFIRLWTTGIFAAENFTAVQDLVDEVYFFLPTLSKEDYLTHTGFDFLDQALDNLAFLIESTKNVVINCPVTPFNVAELPAIYDFACEKKLKLLLHYYPNTDFHPDAVKYIQRFAKSKNVEVLELKKPADKFCLYYPNLKRNSVFLNLGNIIRMSFNHNV